MLEQLPKMVAAETADWFSFLGVRMTVTVRAADTDGKYGLIECVLPAGFAPPPHIHHSEDEQFYLVEGRLTFRCAGQTIAAGPGDIVLLPRGVPHTFVVEEPGPARVLQITTPGGVEEFFAGFGTPLSVLAAAPDGPPDFKRLAELATQYQIEFVESA